MDAGNEGRPPRTYARRRAALWLTVRSAAHSIRVWLRHHAASLRQAAQRRTFASLYLGWLARAGDTERAADQPGAARA